MSPVRSLSHFRDCGLRLGQSFARVAIVVTLASSLVAGAPLPNQQEPASKTHPDVKSQGNAGEAEQLRKTVQQLRSEVTHLKKRVAELEQDHQGDALQDRIGKEQQRAEVLHAQLLGTMEKEAALQSRKDQIDEQLRPDNIDNLPVGGSLAPEKARDAARRRLTNEKQRIQSQLDLLRQDHTRLQASLVDSDAAIQRLQLRLNDAVRP